MNNEIIFCHTFNDYEKKKKPELQERLSLRGP